MYCSVLRGPATEQLYQHTGKLRIGLQLFEQIGNIRRHLRPRTLPDGLLCLPHIRVCEDLDTRIVFPTRLTTNSPLFINSYAAVRLMRRICAISSTVYTRESVTFLTCALLMITPFPGESQAMTSLYHTVRLPGLQHFVNFFMFFLTTGKPPRSLLPSIISSLARTQPNSSHQFTGISINFA